MKLTSPTRNDVFVWGGQPSHTYVERSHLKIEEAVSRSIKTPNQVVSLAGPTKSGKTVLCRKLLSDTPYVWVEGGQIASAGAIWEKVCYELNVPEEVAKSRKTEAKIETSAGFKFVVSGGGSHLRADETRRTYKLDSMASAIRSLQEDVVTLAIDDFHYLPADARASFLRNIKGPVFNGLKLILLSVAHRRHDAIRSESELQGRVISVLVPEWELDDLRQIGIRGFAALNVICPHTVLMELAAESQSSPFLMQQLCWEVCADLGIERREPITKTIPPSFDLTRICKRISESAGRPTYMKLGAGPEIRKSRTVRQFSSGETGDIYKAILHAIAATGPKRTLTYNELRESLSSVLRYEGVPQKHQITTALKLMAKISQQIGEDAGIDWDEDNRQVDISDPYLRFYLRWQVRNRIGEAPSS